jgi:hypothetical protein
MENKSKVIIKIYAGSGWEGHVVYYIADPKKPSNDNRVNTIDEVKNFCEINQLSIDEDFLILVRKHLYFDKKYGLIVPPTEIDENSPITSAGQFFKKYLENDCF